MRPFLFVLEVDVTVDAAVCSLFLTFLLRWLGIDHPDRPQLKLKTVDLRQRLRAADVTRCAKFLEGPQVRGERMPQSPAHERDSHVGNVNPDPLPPQPLGCYQRRSTPTEWIENNVALVAARFDDAFQKCLWLLSGVIEPFVRLRINGRNVFPKVLELHARRLVKVHL